MNDADSLALLGRVMGGLVVVLVLIGLAARVARRTRGHKGTTGLRVIDRIGLSREASLTVVEIADRVLLLGVTAQGVTLLADLDPPTAQDGGQQDDLPDSSLQPDQDDRFGRPATTAGAQPLANPERGTVKGRVPADGAPGAQRRPVPTGVALEQYPDLASALRAAGRTSGSSHPTTASRMITSAPQDGSTLPAAAAPDLAVPRTRAEARAEARVRASISGRSPLQAPAPAAGRAPVPLPASAEATASSRSAEVDRIPTQRGTSPAATQRVVPVPAKQASGSVLSPRTWRQGIDALRDLTVRRG